MVHSDEQWYASYLELMLVLLYQQWRLRRLGSYRSPFTQAALACVVFSSALVAVNGILTCVLTGPCSSHASTSVACVWGSVACVYFCRMRPVLYGAKRARANGMGRPQGASSLSAALSGPKGTVDASLGHKDSLA